MIAKILDPLTGQFVPFKVQDSPNDDKVIDDVEYTSTVTYEPASEDSVEVKVTSNFDFFSFQQMLKDTVKQQRFQWELDHDGKRKRAIPTYLTLTTRNPIRWQQRNQLLDKLLGTYQFDDVQFETVNHPVRKRVYRRLERFYKTVLILL